MLSEAGGLPGAAALVDGVEDDGEDQHAHGRGHAHSGLVGAVLAGPGDDGAVGNHVLSPASLRRHLGYDEPEGHRQNRCRSNGLHVGGRWSSSAGTCSFVLSFSRMSVSVNFHYSGRERQYLDRSTFGH